MLVWALFVDFFFVVSSRQSCRVRWRVEIVRCNSYCGIVSSSRSCDQRVDVEEIVSRNCRAYGVCRSRSLVVACWGLIQTVVEWRLGQRLNEVVCVCRGLSYSSSSRPCSGVERCFGTIKEKLNGVVCCVDLLLCLFV